MSLADDIKAQIRKSGANKSKIIYFKPGIKIRIRFLQDMDDGMKILFHDSFDKGINHPCQELYDRECEHHDDEDLRHRDQYIWSVWDYEAKEVKLLMGPANQYSPIPQLVGFFETYGTLTDRDYVITQTGTQTNKSFSVVPMDKAKFKNSKAKPFSESKLLSILDKAFPAEEVEDEEDDDEEDRPKKGKGKNKGKKHPAEKKKGKGKARDYDDDEDDEDIDEDEEEDEEDDEEESEYGDMTAKELYQLCKKRKINVKPKKSEEYYIQKLEEADAEDDEEEDDEEGEW